MLPDTSAKRRCAGYKEVIMGLIIALCWMAYLSHVMFGMILFTFGVKTNEWRVYTIQVDTLVSVMEWVEGLFKAPDTVTCLYFEPRS